MVTWLHLLVSYDVTSYVFNWLQLVTLVTCNWLHFDLGGYMVTVCWLQVLSGLILSVTDRRTQQPRPHCPPLCSLLSATPERPPLMLRTAALDFVNVCQLIAAPISLFITPKKFHNADGRALFKDVGKIHPRRSGQPLVNLQQLRAVGRSLFIGVGKTPRVPHIPSG